jgi:hypothetical protein
MEATALVATIFLTVLTLFQLALAAGAPWGSAAYGGAFPGVLPKGIRINSLVFGLVLYPLIILYVLDAGAVVESSWLPGRSVAVWVLVAFFAIGTVANAASRSKIERVWAPVTLVIGVCTLILALG